VASLAFPALKVEIGRWHRPVKIAVSGLRYGIGRVADLSSVVA
jgi:hypothetical protein